MVRFHPTRVVHKGIGEIFVKQMGTMLFGVPASGAPAGPNAAG